MSPSVLARPRPVYRAEELLGAYLPGSFYYSSARGSLLADGVHASVGGQAGARAQAAAEAMDAAAAAGVSDPVVVGAIGFRPDDEASLVVPAVVRRAAASNNRVSDRAAVGSPPGRWSVTPRPEPDVYVETVHRALARIAEGELRKVVLARGLELTADAPISVPSLLSRLVVLNPDAHVFAVDVTTSEDPAPRSLIGASPELLVARRGDTVVANPLAGSLPRVADEAENRRRIEALRTSAKDRAEHAYVADQVAGVLSRFCTELTVPDGPDVIGTATMWHLSTRITGRIANPTDPAFSSLALAEALHPTPAVCGTPTDLARDVIKELESQNRGYYAGLVGWTDHHGDGEWVVTIRSAEVCDRTMWLSAGAGIVEGSDPTAELTETSAKLRTLLRALGLEDIA
ncbi:isochorismate synthase [Saccharomonospora viridis]|uniref:isochorismate synthase n=2 Tax=Saccharomonospora viridis TaxID=1852 RepID=UPI00059B73A7|nr:isochorismate synthase [Saccharomonospora viridis]